MLMLPANVLKLEYSKTRTASDNMFYQKEPALRIAVCI